MITIDSIDKFYVTKREWNYGKVTLKEVEHIDTKQITYEVHVKGELEWWGPDKSVADKKVQQHRK